MDHACHVDYLVLGAGPAGLQAAYFFQRAGRSYRVLEKAARPGAFFTRFPRHRTLLSINKVYTGYDDRERQLRYDWNSLLCDDPEMTFSRYSDEYFPDADDLVRYLGDFARRFDLKIQFNTQVCEVRREPRAMGAFVATDQHARSYRSRVLIVATGCPWPYVPDIPDIEHAEIYNDFSIDRAEFRNQRVLILGKSNSALETANHLTGVARAIHICSPHPLRMAWKTHYVGDIRAVNNDFLDTYLLKGQNASLDAVIERIDPADGEYHVRLTFSHAQGQRAVMAYDRILCCTGFRWDPTIFAEDCRPELSPCRRLPAMTSAWESPNIPDLYFAGTLMQYRDAHKTMSNVIHGFRSNILALSRILERRYHGVPLPHRRAPLSLPALADLILDQASRSCGMFQQPGFLGDLLVVNQEERTFDYYDTLPVDYVCDSELSQHDHYYLLTLEYGPCPGDVFAVHREPDAARAENDVYLHPRLRRYRRGELQDEHHISESLENDWRTDAAAEERPVVRALDFVGQTDPSRYRHTHRDALMRYLARTLGESLPGELRQQVAS